MHADLDIDRGVSFGLERRLQSLLFHARLHPHQDGLNLARPLSYAASHLAGTCVVCRL